MLLGGCRRAPTPDNSDSTPAPSSPVDELRGVWVSYLDLDAMLNGADAATAAARIDAMMAACRDRQLNAVFFHVRAYSDAYYASAVFPPAASAATLLAGGFDPLTYAVEAAHARGLTIHAWINPYRIGKNKKNAVLGGDDVFCKGDVWTYNPASPSVRGIVLDGVREILEHYAVDGIHFDDYFYPDGMSDGAEPFETVPDGISVADWRRTQVSTLVSAVHGLARANGRVFGISPMALVHTCRDKAYADVERWLAQAGYVDYLCPQIYFGFEHTSHPFDETLAAWLAMPRHRGAKLYVGLALYKEGATDPYAGDGRNEWCERDDIIPRQIAAVKTSGADGYVLFRYAQLTT